MSNDGRYMYHHNQGLHSPYEYSYPPTYDTASLQQPPAHRAVRTPSAQSHSPSQAQFNTPPSPYPQSYPASYMTHPHHQQWTGDNAWSQYNQSFHTQQQVQPETPYNSGPGRPEPSVPTPESPRSYVPPPVNPTAPSRREGRQTPAAPSPLNPSPPSLNKSRRRDLEVSPPVSNVPGGTPAVGLDYRKLLDSYKLIIDTNNNYSNGVGHAPHRAPPMDTALVERMLQAASYGAQMLQSAVHVPHPPSISPVARSPKSKEPEAPVNNANKDSGNSANTAVKRQKADKADDSGQEGQTCLGCGATSTPEWRRGPMGPRTLCNACGLVYAKLIKKRVKENARAGKITDQGSRGHGGDDLTSSPGGDSDDDYRSRSSQ